MPIKLLLVEDHPIFRFGVRQLILQRWPDAEIGEAGSLAEAVQLIRTLQPDIALLDLNLPDSEGLEIVSHVQRAAPGTRLLVLSLNAETAYARRSLQLGAAGYLAKDRAANELVTAIERILAGSRYITASLAEQLADDLISGSRPALPHEILTTQEYRVMLQLAGGARVGDVAEGMHLSPKTVSTYRARILDKLQLASNADLTRYCLNHRLIDNV